MLIDLEETKKLLNEVSKKMKKISFLLVFSILVSTNIFAKDVVKFAIGEWSPYTSEKNKSGKLVEIIVKEAFKLEGIDVEYSYYPWARSLKNTEIGEADGSFPWNKTAEREKKFYIPKEILIKDEGVFFHLKNKKFDWNSLEDLKKYKVGVTIGYKNEYIYKEKGIDAEAVPNEESNFKKILAGRIDVYQTSKVVGYYTINNLFKPTDVNLFTNHPKVFEISEYYILFSKKTANGKMFSEKFDSGLKKLKSSGKYDEIINNFFR